jgi:hypothetical protein
VNFRKPLYLLVIWIGAVFLSACTISTPSEELNIPLETTAAFPIKSPASLTTTQISPTKPTPIILSSNAHGYPAPQQVVPSPTLTAGYPGPDFETPAATQVLKTGLVATDPGTVQLASGKPQLVEFFAFW